MSALATMPTTAQYDATFQIERLQVYPTVDALEHRYGYAVGRDRLEQAARVLACPLKSHPPNWQHGRVLYTMARTCLSAIAREPFTLLDIGTAKGFSALCLQWALLDSGWIGQVTSVDVIDPASRERRNTVAEVGGWRTLGEILAPWPEATDIDFHKASGHEWLKDHHDPIHVAFVDGKHSYVAVRIEAALLSERQQPGDLAIFDDVQIAGVAQALGDVKDYDFEYLNVLPERRYAIGRRR